MKARLKFSKAGSMKFIGHLDVMRFFQKALRRAEINVSYSQGYSPHQLLSFAAPLGVGLTSDGEYLDLQLEESIEKEEFISRLNAVMNDEIQVVDFIMLSEQGKNAMSIVAAADYMISLKDGYEDEKIECFQEKFKEYMEQNTIVVWKKTKKSEKEVDIKPLIYSYSFSKEEFYFITGSMPEHSVADSYQNETKVYLQVATGSVKNLKPELVLEGFYHYIGKEWNPFAYQVHRIEVYSDINLDPKNPEKSKKSRKLVPLING